MHRMAFCFIDRVSVVTKKYRLRQELRWKAEDMKRINRSIGIAIMIGLSGLMIIGINSFKTEKALPDAELIGSNF